MNQKEVIKELTIEDLPEPYDQYAQQIGIENLYKLSKNFGGTTIYIPQVDALFKEWKYNKIKEEYNGYNIKQLAVKYGVSDRTVQKICSGAKVKMEGQIDLFGLESL